MKIVRADPLQVRDEVIDLLWEHRHWPGESRAEYERLWDWRYTALSDGDPLVWVARADGTEKVVGHNAIFPRRFRIGTKEIRGAVPGDALMHRDYRSGLASIQLFQQPMNSIRHGEFDFAISFATPLAHRILERLGFRDLGRFEDYVEIRRSRRVLERRARFAAYFAPAVDAALALRRSLRRYRGVGNVRSHSWRIEEIPATDLSRIDRSHWVSPAADLVGADSLAYIERRFLLEPGKPRSVFGIVNQSTDRLDAYLIVSVGDRATIDDCQTNGDSIDVPSAVAKMSRHLSASRGIGTCVFTTLPQTAVAANLVKAGFFPRSLPEYVDFRIGAFWMPDHPCAQQFERVERWHLFRGSAEF